MDQEGADRGQAAGVYTNAEASPEQLATEFPAVQRPVEGLTTRFRQVQAA